MHSPAVLPLSPPFGLWQLIYHRQQVLLTMVISASFCSSQVDVMIDSHGHLVARS